MDQLICAYLSHTHYWYEVGMLKVPAYIPARRFMCNKCTIQYNGGFLPVIILLTLWYYHRALGEHMFV